jgi:hypothetical protein
MNNKNYIALCYSKISQYSVSAASWSLIIQLPFVSLLIMFQRLLFSITPIAPLTSVSRPALGSTQPPLQWVPGVLSPEVKRGRGVMLTTHPYLIQRSWMSRSYTSSPQAPQWRVEGLLFYSKLFSLTLSVSFHRGSPYPCIIRGMNNRPLGGRSSET